MATAVWLTRQTKLNGGRLGAVRVADDVATDLVKKGDALPFDRNLRAALRAFNAAEAEPNKPKRRGRPPKPDDSDLADAAQPDEPEPEESDGKGND